jgi:hypothetical protein
MNDISVVVEHPPPLQLPLTNNESHNNTGTDEHMSGRIQYISFV